MAWQRIVLMRHADKPLPGRGEHAIDARGALDVHGLTPRGWQRAGAIAVGCCAVSDWTPQRLFAAASTPLHKSRRCTLTLQPLALKLGLRLNDSFEVGQEAALAQHLRALPGTTVVAWSHEGLVRLAAEVMGPNWSGPVSWPDERFDVIWCLERDDGDTAMRFVQHMPRWLPGDLAREI